MWLKLGRQLVLIRQFAGIYEDQSLSCYLFQGGIRTIIPGREAARVNPRRETMKRGSFANYGQTVDEAAGVREGQQATKTLPRRRPPESDEEKSRSYEPNIVERATNPISHHLSVFYRLHPVPFAEAFQLSCRSLPLLCFLVSRDHEMAAAPQTAPAIVTEAGNVQTTIASTG
jgi:hypothetical protein